MFQLQHTLKRHKTVSRSSGPKMYVGPWEEFRLMRAMDELCRQPHGMDPGATPAVYPFVSAPSPSRSHHLHVGLDRNVDTSVARRRWLKSSQGGKPATCPRCKIVRAISHFQTQQSGELFTNSHGETVKLLDDPYQFNAVPTYSMAKRIESDRNCTQRIGHNASQEPNRSGGRALSTGSTNLEQDPPVSRKAVEIVLPSAYCVQSTRVEMGTGIVHKITKLEKPKLLKPTMDNRFRVVDTTEDVSPWQKLSMLKELVLAPPLDTEAKYMLAKQKPPPKQLPCKGSKDDEDRDIKEQIERRLRLQMLYGGGQYDGLLPAVGELGKHQATPREGIDTLKHHMHPKSPVTSVPWDFRAPGSVDPFMQAPRSAADVVAKHEVSHAHPTFTNQTSRHVPLATHRLDTIGSHAAAHPVHDNVHAPFIGDQVKLTVNKQGPAGLETPHRAINSAQADPQRGDTMGRCTMESQPERVEYGGQCNGADTADTSAAACSNQTAGAEQFDDDVVEGLINWAEQLDPDSIV
uniref:Uncharacterized protein n=1 Tax=Trypanosoma congolense (strain IL3000) TaxID=1068625 RepID=G0UYS3_TRYCI|nr:conserved hypothetical protein [Trypanosoma congolense IL3000]